MFERFDEGARKAMALARKEAGRFRSESIGPEHLLLGILGAGGGPPGSSPPWGSSRPGRRRGRGGPAAKYGVVRPGAAPFTPRRGGSSRRPSRRRTPARESPSAGAPPPRDPPGPEGIAFEVLRKLGLEAEAVAKKVSEAPGEPAGPRKEEEILGRLTAGAREAIVLAEKEARALRHDFLGTLHLLLGIAGTRGGAEEIFAALGVKPEEIRGEVLASIKPGSAEALRGGSLDAPRREGPRARPG